MKIKNWYEEEDILEIKMKEAEYWKVLNCRMV